MHRYDQIMADIDDDLTDEELARKYYKQSQTKCENSFRQAVACMHVYRLVHDGTTTNLRDTDGCRVGAPTWSGLTIRDMMKIIKGEW